MRTWEQIYDSDGLSAISTGGMINLIRMMLLSEFLIADTGYRLGTQLRGVNLVVQSIWGQYIQSAQI